MSRRVVAGSSVVVVGATSGVGRALTLSLAAVGARLTVVARDAAALGRVAEECARLDAPVATVPGDIADPEVVARIVRTASERYGRIDTWVNCAAVLVAGRLEDQPIEEIAEIIRVDVLGTALASRAALTQFGQQGEGVLVNVASLLGLVPNPLVPTYVMAKFAVRGLSLSLHEAARGQHGVRVCTVLPGPIDTPMFERAGNYTGRGLRAIPPAASPERAAATVMRSIRRPRRQRTVGAMGAVIVVGHRFVPRVVETMVARFAAATLVRRQPWPPTTGGEAAARAPSAASGGWRRGRIRSQLGDALGRTLARRA